MMIYVISSVGMVLNHDRNIMEYLFTKPCFMGWAWGFHGFILFIFGPFWAHKISEARVMKHGEDSYVCYVMDPSLCDGAT